MPKKKNTQIRAKKAPNTNLQKQCQEKKIAQIRAKKKHLTPPHKD